MKIVGNSKYQKAANASLILNYLRREGSTSRSRIAEELGLQPSTVTYIMNRMLQAELVEETRDAATPGSGRRPIKITLNRNYGAVIGLDLQADYYNAVITDIAGRPIETVHREYDRASSTFEDRFSSVMREVESLVPGEIPVLGAGVAIPGIVDPSVPLIEDCWSHNLRQRNLKRYIEKNYSYPIFIENDANCCAWRFLWYESVGNKDSFIYLLPRFHRKELLPDNYPSVGIGMGLVYNGEIYNGFTYRAGEFRSLFFKQSGTVPGQITLSTEEMNRIAHDDTVKRKLVHELLGTIILFMYFTNPRALYIGGDLAKEGPLIQDVLEHELAYEWEQLDNSGIQLKVLEDAGGDAARGAAAAMLQTLYTIPQVGTGEQNARIWKSLLTNLIDHN